MQSVYENLIYKLESHGILETPEITEAFRTIKREDFLPLEYKKDAYKDHPIPIGYNATNSQPTTVALMLELLQPKEGERIMEVGSGSGWVVALLAEIVGKGGFVYGVEIVRELAKFGGKNIKKYNMNNVDIVYNDERDLGLPDSAPFDKIMVSAASDNIPEELLEQLKKGGRMVIPVGSSIVKVDITEKGVVNKEEFPGFNFVPLKQHKHEG